MIKHEYKDEECVRLPFFPTVAWGTFWNMDSSICGLLLVVNIKDKCIRNAKQSIQNTVEIITECDETDVS